MNNTVDIEVVNSRPVDFGNAVAEAVKAALEKTDSQLLNAEDAAAFIGVCRSTWYTLKSEGKLPAPIRLGKRVFWRREEVIAWVDAGCPESRKWEKSKSYRL